MKKIVSVCLALCLLLSCFAVLPAAAFTPTGGGSMPLVLLSGDGNTIYDESGNEAPKFTDVVTDAFTGKNNAADTE